MLTYLAKGFVPKVTRDVIIDGRTNDELEMMVLDSVLTREFRDMGNELIKPAYIKVQVQVTIGQILEEYNDAN